MSDENEQASSTVDTMQDEQVYLQTMCEDCDEPMKPTGVSTCMINDAQALPFVTVLFACDTCGEAVVVTRRTVDLSFQLR